ncbi:MAG: glucosaminidase domain-containing protein [Oscillospiraceae bacterium]|nr:glucosaminidase domain-containing protein [Oscillospiraceae bacterium]
MKKILKELFWSLLFGALLAAIILFLTVEAFAYELPGIEEPCGMTEEELGAVLKGELKQYAREFLWAEEDYQINACFLASIAALESGWGEHLFRPNNIFGFMTKREFSSIPENIDFVAWYLRKHYLNEEGRYYRGGTIEAVGRIYCPDDGTWVRLVTEIYGGMFRNEMGR